MNKHYIDAIPAATGLAAALVDAAINWAGAYNFSGASAALYVSLGIALGRGVSLWLHSRATPPTPPAAP